MNSNNKKRLLKLIEILQRKTDIDHPLSLKQIVVELEKQGIEIQDRKTLYDDFKVLSETNYEVEYNDGYYLCESPFSLSEIKIITDSINSLKNLDDKLLVKLNNKLYSFISEDEEKRLRKLEYHNNHSDKKFINRLEDTLDALKNNKSIIIKRINKDEEEIIPLFLYRNNDYYYLYYHYLNNEKIYHTRFDNILNIKHGINSDNINIPKSRIIEYINESTNSFYSNKSQIVRFEIIKDSDYLRTRLLDDFPNGMYTKKGFSIKASINDVLFSKLTSYTDEIRIIDDDIRHSYVEFLKKIITQNKG